MSELFSTLNDRKGEVLTTILEHIQISFIALLIACYGSNYRYKL